MYTFRQEGISKGLYECLCAFQVACQNLYGIHIDASAIRILGGQDPQNSQWDYQISAVGYRLNGARESKQLAVAVSKILARATHLRSRAWRRQVVDVGELDRGYAPCRAVCSPLASGKQLRPTVGAGTCSLLEYLVQCTESADALVDIGMTADLLPKPSAIPQQPKTPVRHEVFMLTTRRQAGVRQAQLIENSSGQVSVPWIRRTDESVNECISALKPQDGSVGQINIVCHQPGMLNKGQPDTCLTIIENVIVRQGQDNLTSKSRPWVAYEEVRYLPWSLTFMAKSGLSVDQITTVMEELLVSQEDPRIDPQDLITPISLNALLSLGLPAVPHLNLLRAVEETGLNIAEIRHEGLEQLVARAEKMGEHFPVIRPGGLPMDTINRLRAETAAEQLKNEQLKHDNTRCWTIAEMAQAHTMDEPWKKDDVLLRAQLLDERMGQFIRYLLKWRIDTSGQCVPDTRPETERGLHSQASRREWEKWEPLLVAKDGLAHYRQKPASNRPNDGDRFPIFLPEKYQDLGMRKCHDEIVGGGHLGEQATINRVREHFWWPTLPLDVVSYVKECPECNLERAPARRKIMPLRPHGVPCTPWHTIGMDILGPFSKQQSKVSGNRYALVAIDFLTHAVEVMPLRDQLSATVIEAFEDGVCCRHGWPRVLLTDQGSNFTSEMMRTYAQRLSIKQMYTAAHHQSANGLAEGVNKAIVRQIRAYITDNPEDWSANLAKFVFNLNTRTNRGTNESPFYLTYGRDPWYPLNFLFPMGCEDQQPYEVQKHVQNLRDAWNYAQVYSARSREAMRIKHDVLHRLTSYSVGDQVFLMNDARVPGKSKKLFHLWSGPFRVIDKLDEGHYRLSRGMGDSWNEVVHGARLKLYVRPSVELDQEASVLEQEQEEDPFFNYPSSDRRTSTEVAPEPADGGVSDQEAMSRDIAGPAAAPASSNSSSSDSSDCQDTEEDCVVDVQQEEESQSFVDQAWQQPEFSYCPTLPTHYEPATQEKRPVAAAWFTKWTKQKAQVAILWEACERGTESQTRPQRLWFLGEFRHVENAQRGRYAAYRGYVKLYLKESTKVVHVEHRKLNPHTYGTLWRLVIPCLYHLHRILNPQEVETERLRRLSLNPLSLDPNSCPNWAGEWLLRKSPRKLELRACIETDGLDCKIYFDTEIADEAQAYQMKECPLEDAETTRSLGSTIWNSLLNSSL